MWSSYWNEKWQRKPKNWGEKPPQYPPQIRHNLTWSWTRTTMEGGLVGGEGRPAPWPMSRSTELKLNWGSCCYRIISRDVLRWSLKDSEGKEKDLSRNEFWHLYRQTGLIKAAWKLYQNNKWRNTMLCFHIHFCFCKWYRYCLYKRNLRTTGFFHIEQNNSYWNEISHL